MNSEYEKLGQIEKANFKVKFADYLKNDIKDKFTKERLAGVSDSINTKGSDPVVSVCYDFLKAGGYLENDATIKEGMGKYLEINSSVVLGTLSNEGISFNKDSFTKDLPSFMSSISEMSNKTFSLISDMNELKTKNEQLDKLGKNPPLFGGKTKIQKLKADIAGLNEKIRESSSELKKQDSEMLLSVKSPNEKNERGR